MTIESDLAELRVLQARLNAMSGRRVKDPFWFHAVPLNQEFPNVSHSNLKQPIGKGTEFHRKVRTDIEKLRRTPTRPTTMGLDIDDTLEQIAVTHASDPEALGPIIDGIVVAKRARGWSDIQIKLFLTEKGYPDSMIERSLGDVAEIDTSALEITQPDIQTLSLDAKSRNVGQPDVGVSLSTIAGRQRDEYNRSLTPAQIDAAVNGILSKDRMDNKLRTRPACY